MRKALIAAAAFALGTAAQAADSPLWMRYPAISPEGNTIAFCFQGDIFTVPAKGGRATQITSNPAYDYQPVWSPDGTRIAFASNRNGNFDVFVVDRNGGAPVQITSHSSNEVPEAFLNDSTVLFSAFIQPETTNLMFPSSSFPQIYSVGIQGDRRPVMFSPVGMENISVNPIDGTLLYTDKKGYEDPWRKHHKSSITRDVWMCNPDGRTGFSKITTFRGEDRNPVWTADGKAFYYLSEEDGSFNVYKGNPGSVRSKQVTRHTKHPVRFLSMSKNGKLAYGYNGEIYTLKDGAEPQKVNITIVKDDWQKPVNNQTLHNGASRIAVSPNGKEIAFTARGDVYVTSTDYSTTKQITDTPQQERNIDFSPDGRSLVYSAERDGVWGIYRTSLVRDDDKYFTYAQELEETPLVVSDKASFQPLYSPDGKEVAFLEDRTTLRVINLDTKQIRTVLDGKYNYSYSDGDVAFQWSPDSKWFLVDFIGIGGWNNPDIALVKADGSGQITNLTESGYSDSNAKWVLDGKAMVWESDRAGYRSHGSWGAESDAYIMFFDGEAYDKFMLSKEDAALADEKDEKKDDDADKKEASKKDAPKKGKKDTADKPAVKDLKFDLDNRRDRVVRLTGNSSHLGDYYLNKKGDKFYYTASFEKGYDLWEHDLKDHSTKILVKGAGASQLLPDKEGKKLYLPARGAIKEVELAGGKTKNVDFAAEFNNRPAQEREYIFNHAWRQVKDKFYDPEIHGIDWEGYRDEYARFLPYITNNFDFRDMLSEMLGELNGSHTGARYNPVSSTPPTASLGAFYDPAYTGDGLKITEIIARGPLTKADTQIVPGCIVEKIDGQKIEAGKDFYPLLAGKADKKVKLSVLNPVTGKRFEETVKPITYAAQNGLLYRRWVENNRKKVEKLSGGRIGYVHVKGMDSPSFREVYSDLLGRYRNCDAVIIDTRHNGGGWLHDDLATLLSGKEYANYTPRGNYIGSDPFNKWLKPSCVLVCEDNYSNAHGFPWVYKTLDIGKLIGTPVPGTMTAVWWETQIDPSLIFGIPQVGCRDMNGNYLENQELQPDIVVYNTPEMQITGEDLQLETAVKEMLRQTGTDAE